MAAAGRRLVEFVGLGEEAEETLPASEHCASIDLRFGDHLRGAGHDLINLDAAILPIVGTRHRCSPRLLGKH